MFQNLKMKFFQFMQGRYGGNDGLNIGLLAIYLVLIVIRTFIRNGFAGWIIYLLSMAVLIYSVFRMFSKNIPARQAENVKFMRFWYKIKPKLVLVKDRVKDIKTKRYRTCPHCKNVLRLPYKRGKHNVRCPKCGKDFSVRII
ncbi:MAG: hypothetical protein E7558_03855 [Ruminococcaceae bacterium]|nr:hypothetical protein [Oscillospiraceae bacterium]